MFFSIVYPKSFSNWKYDFDSTYYDKNTSKLTRKRKIFYTKGTFIQSNDISRRILLYQMHACVHIEKLQI